jgi:hypothetical protein
MFDGASRVLGTVVGLLLVVGAVWAVAWLGWGLVEIVIFIQPYLVAPLAALPWPRY